MARYFYSRSVEAFLEQSEASILGEIQLAASSDVQATQHHAWSAQIQILREQLVAFAGRGTVFFEFTVPRVGKRADVVLVIEGVLFVLEFKVGERGFPSWAREQVWDYALDLKNFHETSHDAAIVPILVCTEAKPVPIALVPSSRHDYVFEPILSAPRQIANAIASVLGAKQHVAAEAAASWHEGRYKPTPTIIEAAVALYSGHAVQDISTSGAGESDLTTTSASVIDLVHRAQAESKKIICFVTGVPGAGKTLVGLNISTTKFPDAEGKAVYLSGNGPLVKVLQEALALDKVAVSKGTDSPTTKTEARRAVSSFIQNVHHFRDAYLDDKTAPHNHIAIFDEAQRAWDVEATARFMREKKNTPGFDKSEAEFLISCMDRHKNWSVIVCLVGGGQEINRGEAGIAGWMSALTKSFTHWETYLSPELIGPEYVDEEAIQHLAEKAKVERIRSLHLATSMRSFKATGLADLVSCLLNREVAAARQQVEGLKGRYPLVLTRSVSAAKDWLRSSARGSERYGMLVSSQAQRLKPHAIDVRVATNPVHWFLKDKDDVRSSFFLEDAATEFDVQGLEVDWSCVVWDGDFRFADDGWIHSSFKGNRWERIGKPTRQAYQKNAYRVLLTRARQGMAIVIPEGDRRDKTRLPEMYDSTYKYLESLGLQVLD